MELMKPISLFESGNSNGSVSLSAIINGEDIMGVSSLDFESLISVMRRGGWPEAIKMDDDKKYDVSRDYVEDLLNEKIQDKNKVKMRRVLENISRNISRSVSKVKLARDSGVSRPTLDDYLNTLEKLYILEYIPATNLNLRSKTPLRVSPKLEFVDPSIVTATLNLKRDDLVNDLRFMGFIFENMCMRDLKIYADAIDARLSYYRDKNDFEVDCILETANGKWGAIEIKLGAGEIPSAVNNLTKFRDKVDADKYGEPAFLMVLTGADYSYKRDDGIYVVSIGTLKN